MCPLRVPLPHVHRFRDRHGRLRHYLRLPGRPKVPLRGDPESPEFLAAYQAAIAAPPAPKPPPGRVRAAPGTLDALAASYYASTAYKGHSASTKATYRRIIERLRDTHGGEVFAELTPKVVRGWMRDMQETPAAANHLLRVLRLLAAHGIETDVLDADPTAGVRRLRYAVKGYTPWSEADIAAFETRWASGTKERLALCLLLYTTQRRSDVVKMGRHLMQAGRIVVVQQKTGRRLLITPHPALLAEIACWPDQVMFLLTERGEPFTANGFYNWFIERAQMAGLPPGLSPHGLRKAGLRRVAERGGTLHHLSAVGGQKTLSVLQLYTEDADQIALADAAIGLMPGAGPGTPTG